MEKQMTVSKLNILEKIRWKIQYRELDKLCGQYSRIANLLMKDKNIQFEYKKNKKKILSVLKESKKAIPNKFEPIINAIFDALPNQITFDEENYPQNLLDNIFSNVRHMLEIKGLGGKVNEHIVNSVTQQDLTERDFSSTLISLTENKYSEETIENYPIDILKKITNISDNDLREMSATVGRRDYIINAVKNGISSDNIKSYVDLHHHPINNYEIESFLEKNMQFSSFFLKWAEKNGNDLPSSYLIEQFLPYTKNMNVKIAMKKMNETPEFYRDLRDKWFDFKIENCINNR